MKGKKSLVMMAAMALSLIFAGCNNSVVDNGASGDV